MIPLIPPALTQAPASKDFQTKCAAFSKAKDWKGLEAFARSYAEAHPQDAPSRAALGFALFAQNRVEGGRTACQEAISLDPKSVLAYQYLGMQAAAEGDRAGVLDWGARLEKVSPEAAHQFFKSQETFCVAGEDPKVLCVDFAKIVITASSFPGYPPAAKSARIQGLVDLDVTIGVDGVPIKVTALCGPFLLRRESENCAMAWRFKPWTVNGQSSPARFHLVMVYRLS